MGPMLGPFPISDVQHAMAVALAFLLVFLSAEAWRAWGGPYPELSRKAVHFFGGLVACAFPWLFASPGLVWLLAGGFAAVLMGTRALGLLKSVHGVDRESLGVLYFPISVGLLFQLAHAVPVLYLVSMLTMVVADALAAVLGKAYGRNSYRVEGDWKSLEGSAAFLLATFLVVHLPLLLMTRMDRPLCVLVALQIAVLVTCFEAISPAGLDNLVVPMGTWYLLIHLDQAYVSWMLIQLLGQAAIILLVSWLALHLKVFSFSAAVGLQLFFYGALSLGNPEWVLAPALAVLAYSLFAHRLGAHLALPDSRVQLQLVFNLAALPALLYILNNAWLDQRWILKGLPASPLFYVAYCGLVAGQASSLLQALWRHWRKSLGWQGLAASLLLAMAWVLPLSLWVGPGTWSATQLGWAALCCLASGLGASLLCQLWGAGKGSLALSRLQLAGAGLGLLLIMPLYLLQLGGPR